MLQGIDLNWIKVRLFENFYVHFSVWELLVEHLASDLLQALDLGPGNKGMRRKLYKIQVKMENQFTNRELWENEEEIILDPFK